MSADSRDDGDGEHGAGSDGRQGAQAAGDRQAAARSERDSAIPEPRTLARLVGTLSDPEARRDGPQIGDLQTRLMSAVRSAISDTMAPHAPDLAAPDIDLDFSLAPDPSTTADARDLPLGAVRPARSDPPVDPFAGPRPAEASPTVLVARTADAAPRGAPGGARAAWAGALGGGVVAGLIVAGTLYADRLPALLGERSETRPTVASMDVPAARIEAAAPVASSDGKEATVAPIAAAGASSDEADSGSSKESADQALDGTSARDAMTRLVAKAAGEAVPGLDAAGRAAVPGTRVAARTGVATAPGKPAIEEALRLLNDGDVTGARAMLGELSGDLERADFALAMARSFDPNFLASLPRRNAEGSREDAEIWYRRWYDLAVAEGMVSDRARLERLIQSLQ
ncbi:MAG: hypothetical protein R3D33_09535 [Hyphomicrobiaceae bacterium]